MKKSILAIIGVLASATPAFAHHPLGGQPMETFSHGLLSGIGHPLLGFDHLFFVVAVGIAALFTGYARLAPAAYIGAMLVGCLLMSFGIGLPFKEIIVGLSLLVVGYIILSGRTLGIMPAVALFAIFGLFHGSAFGDVIAAQEASVGAPVLFGYLIGLGCLQYGIALASGYLIVKTWKTTTAQAVEARIAGAAVAGMGVFLTLENLEGIVLGAFV
ncbi:MAG: HupE/UreJ family protein [Sneathiella sp.]|uniref:HupE/UreJ family protein n=1 Tax=Sneathiella sp. TaxID=1964365 RepID=UPI003001D882